MEIYIYRNTGGRRGHKESHLLAQVPDASGVYQITGDTALSIGKLHTKPESYHDRLWYLDLQAVTQQADPEQLPFWKKILDTASEPIKTGLDQILQQRLANPRLVVLNNYESYRGVDAWTKLSNTKSLFISLGYPVSYWDKGIYNKSYPYRPDLNYRQR